MEQAVSYLRVVVPLRLQWEPCYALGPDQQAGIGSRVLVTLSGKPYEGVVSAVDVVPDAPPEKIRPVTRVLDNLPPVSAQEIRLWREVADYYLCTVGEVYKAAYPSEKTAGEETALRQKERLLKRKAALEEKLAKARNDKTRARYQADLESVSALLAGETPSGPLREITLSPSQEEALQEIRTGFADNRTVLLNGVTGSGKTEIYLRLAGDILREGRSVLFMVPEIALSRQLEERVRNVFPQVLVFHSGETSARRAHVVEALRKGPPYLVLGTRSSVFLPHQGLGLIIVDEEHDGSYKQDSPAPRYNGRDMAVMLGRIHCAPVLLGSATPSLESVYNVRTGRYKGVLLPGRFFGGDGADTLIIDTLSERKKGGMDGHISRKLFLEISRVLSEGGQTVLLRARRSWAPSVQCRQCGKPVKCPSCGVPLSLHKEEGAEVLRCHHCGYHETYAGICPSCGGELVPVGAGSQRIEEEVRELFPQARVARLDTDIPDREGAETVRAFARGEIDILVGTQMVTKGFDFAGVSLVAVIQADSVLGIPDFRADEKGLQLLEQFKGRTGRRGHKGLFIIQTAQAEHPVVTGRRAVENLLAERRLFGYPPFTREVKVTLRDPESSRLDALSEALSLDFKTMGDAVKVLGPCQPFEWLQHGALVREIRILLPKDRQLQARKASLLDKIQSFERQFRYYGHISIDVDPL